MFITYCKRFKNLTEGYFTEGIKFNSDVRIYGIGDVLSRDTQQENCENILSS